MIHSRNMAEKKEKSKKEEKATLAEDLRSGSFHRVYLLYGSESYVQARALNKLLSALVPQEDDMNFTRLDEKNATPEQLIPLAETLPFFAERRVILVSDSGLFKKSCPELEEYLPTMPESSVLIFSEKEADKRLKLYKTVSGMGVCEEFVPLDEEGIQKQVVRILRQEGRSMNRAGFEYLLNRVGTSMQDICIELEKLICYTAGREMITVEDIDAVVTPRLEERVFDLTNAIAEKKRKKALDCYYELLTQRTAPMLLLTLLSRQFQTMFTVKSMRARGFDASQIASRAKLHPYAVKKSEQLSSRFSTEELKRALNDCLEAEDAIKSGRMSDKLSLETLIIKYS